MNPKKVIAFDCETGPQPAEKIRHLMPEFKAPGNWKDVTKIQAKIDEQELQWLDRAALSGHTGELLAWGFIAGNGITEKYWQTPELSERDLLEMFWELYNKSIQNGEVFAGSNICGFDVPFLVMRSRLRAVEIPSSILWAKYGEQAGFYDLQDWWNIFPRQNRERISLDAMARTFGHTGKNGSGADFHKVFKTSPEAAMDYLENDLHMTRVCADRLCPKSEPMPTDSPSLI